jgi:phosphate starvation-inducible PhoH-like protein
LTKFSERVIKLSPEEILEFCGSNDERVREIEKRLGARIILRGNEIKIVGDTHAVEEATSLIQNLLDVQRKNGNALSKQHLRVALNSTKRSSPAELTSALLDRIVVPSKRRHVSPLTAGQKKYADAIRTCDIVFGIGPAGTGKTYLAVAMAVAHLLSGAVSRIILVRPAVEAGERLGFLPGDLAAKFDPFVRPLWDALYEMIEPEKVKHYIETGIIEIAPLAFMRGRTLNSAFVILDEGQNTTIDQMKMFLTRLGFDSKAVITGDITQIDLPNNARSGLVHVQGVLKGIEGISFIYFDEHDVVRHELVQKIIRAYEQDERNHKGSDS